MKYDERVSLNKINYSVRTSQIIGQYGPGAMVDFHDQTLMTAAPEFWPDDDGIVRVSDERLQHALNVSGFRIPGGKHDSRMQFTRFPEWYFCPKCRKLMSIRQWQNKYKRYASEKQLDRDRYMAKHLRCPDCRVDLVVARIVVCCENGHISDFPWVNWTHYRNFGGKREVCAHPSLKITTVGSASSGLESMVIECTYCGSKASLRGAFDKNVFHELRDDYGDIFKCPGKHPWAHRRENCNSDMQTLQRGSASVYYPYIVSSIVIPPYSSSLEQEIVNLKSYTHLRNAVVEIKDTSKDPYDESEKVLEKIREYKSRIHDELKNKEKYKDEEIKRVLKRVFLKNNQYAPVNSIAYREEEYRAIVGEDQSRKNDGIFLREKMSVSDYNLPLVKQIVLIKKLSEVRVLTGFTRIKPVEKSDSGDIGSNTKIVDIKAKNDDWYPAYQVFGEGIFVEFDQSEIDKWSKNEIVVERERKLRKHFEKVHPNSDRTISARFILLHTLSHQLIKQLSFECGYNIASLCERIYCSEDEDNMAGILIYTSAGDSEGTLGGLVRQGYSDVFPMLFKKAIVSSVHCSNDPVCSLSEGQGKDALNLSACHSCTLLPETSCEEYNAFLDRGMISGTIDKPDFGFYSDYLNGKKEWMGTMAENVSTSEKEPIVRKLVIEGEPYELDSIKEACDVLIDDMGDAVTDAEKHNLNTIAGDSFAGLEVPAEYLSISDGMLDFVWQKAKVIALLRVNEALKEKIEGSDYSCIMIDAPDFADRIREMIGEDK